MTLHRSLTWIVFSAFIGMAAHLRAAETNAIPSIEVSAEARVEVAADLAVLDFGVVTQAEGAAAAAAENAKRMEAVLAAVRKLLGADARISTGSYTLHTNQSQPRDGSAHPSTPAANVQLHKSNR